MCNNVLIAVRRNADAKNKPSIPRAAGALWLEIRVQSQWRQRITRYWHSVMYVRCDLAFTPPPPPFDAAWSIMGHMSGGRHQLLLSLGVVNLSQTKTYNRPSARVCIKHPIQR